jgi:hypothetical protein
LFGDAFERWYSVLDVAFGISAVSANAAAAALAARASSAAATWATLMRQGVGGLRKWRGVKSPAVTVVVAGIGTLNFTVSPWGNSAVSVASSAAACSRAMVVSASSSAASAARSSVTRVDSSSGRAVFDEAGENGGSSDGWSELAMVVRGACRRALVSAGSLAGGPRDLVSLRFWRTIDW